MSLLLEGPHSQIQLRRVGSSWAPATAQPSALAKLGYSRLTLTASTSTDLSASNKLASLILSITFPTWTLASSRRVLVVCSNCYLNNLFLDGRGDRLMMLPEAFQIALNGFLDILNGLVVCLTLGNATG